MPAVSGSQAIVDIEMADGTTLSARCEHPLGSFENPLSRAQIEQKFRTYAKGSCPTAHVADVIERGRPAGGFRLGAAADGLAARARARGGAACHGGGGVINTAREVRSHSLASHDISLGANQLGPGPAQRALARDFPPDRRELSGDRRAGRLAQSVAHPADDLVAGLGAQRHVGPRTARPGLCAAHLGRAAADRDGAALLRRCADADRRSHRERPPGDRGAGRRLRARRNRSRPC